MKPVEVARAGQPGLRDVPIIIRRPGITDYLQTLTRMREFTCERVSNPDGVTDELWLTEHPPVFTMGFASRREHLHATGAIPVVDTERGGQVTYHGPGQVLAYLMLDLRRRRLGVRELVSRVEAGVIDCLAGYGVTAIRRPGAPGLFISRNDPPEGETSHKIASIGLKVSRGFTWHGLALNGDMDLEPFRLIDPCGYPGLQMTDVSKEISTDSQIELAELGDRLAAALVDAIGG